MCSCDQLRKLVAQVRPVGRMSLEPWACVGGLSLEALCTHNEMDKFKNQIHKY